MVLALHLRSIMLALLYFALVNILAGRVYFQDLDIDETIAGEEGSDPVKNSWGRLTPKGLARHRHDLADVVSLDSHVPDRSYGWRKTFDHIGKPTPRLGHLLSFLGIRATPAASSSGTQNANISVAPPQTQNTLNTSNLNTSNSNTNTVNGVAPGLIGNTGSVNYQQINCSDVTTGRSNKCWNILGLTEYVQTWQKSSSCYEGEGFSGCFLRQNGFPSLDCHAISVSACPAPQSDIVNQDPRTFYVAYNIYGK